MKKPNKCSKIGNYSCQIPMPIQNEVKNIDFCISDIVASLNCSYNTETSSSCCGHREICGHIILKDGRETFILKNLSPEKRMKIVDSINKIITKENYL